MLNSLESEVHLVIRKGNALRNFDEIVMNGLGKKKNSGHIFDQVYVHSFDIFRKTKKW